MKQIDKNFLELEKELTSLAGSMKSSHSGYVFERDYRSIILCGLHAKKILQCCRDMAEYLAPEWDQERIERDRELLR